MAGWRNAPHSPDGQENAAEQAEERGDYRTAYGLWKGLITDWGDIVSQDRVDYWKRHMDYCNSKM